MKQLEIACFNLLSARIAAQAGADRIEFCANYSAGGITPSTNDFSELRKEYTKPIYVMIRPRAGDFVYTKSEIAQMIADIQCFAQLGADGFVFGALLPNQGIDFRNNARLIEATEGLPATFHRAIDLCSTLGDALKQLETLKFTSILSSGGGKTALEGVNALLWMQKNCGLEIIAGGGLRSSNIGQLAAQFETPFYHSSGIITGDVADGKEINALKEQLIPA